MFITIFSIVFILYIVSIPICYFVAKYRGTNQIFWGVMGFIFGPFAIPFVFFSKKIKHD